MTSERRTGQPQTATVRTKPSATAALAAAAILLAGGVAGCGKSLKLGDLSGHPKSSAAAPSAPTRTSAGGGSIQLPSSSGGATGAGLSGQTEKLTVPAIATKNTSRIAGNDPVADAAAVALTVYPSVAPGTHPASVVLAPSSDWASALAASALMAQPLRAPLLYSGPTALPTASSQALSALAPTGDKTIGGTQVIRVGNVASPAGLRSRSIAGSDPYTIAAGVDKFLATVDGRPSINVVLTSTTAPAYAMPVAGWAAESGEPVLFLNGATIPPATQAELLTHHKPHLYVVDPPSVVPDSTLKALKKYGSVKRITAADPIQSAITFAEYRDPPCPSQQLCYHEQGSFGWAITSPGHGFVILNDNQPLDAAAAAPLSASGAYGPSLLVSSPNRLPVPLLRYLCTYAVPGYGKEGPTQAFYDHVWMVGSTNVISVATQAVIDAAIEIQPVSKSGSCV